MPVPSAPAVPLEGWRSWALRLLVILLGTYVGIVVVLMFLENTLVFQPTRAAVHWEKPPSPEIRDVAILSSDGNTIHGWWLPHPDAAGALLYLHGNAGNLSFRGPTILELHDALKTSVLIIDYPGYGKSAGTPTEQGCYRAADAAYEWLTGEQKIPSSEIVIFGKSLGGGVATDLASRHDHRALVLVKTFTSLPAVAGHLYPWVPAGLLMRNRFDSAAKIASCHRPVFVAHGATDGLIPFALGKRLFDAANPPKEFFDMGAHDHNDPFPEEFYHRLAAFLQKHPADRHLAAP